MAKKESRRVKTLSSFMKWAEQFEPGLYLFRGISNEKYPIQASAYRRLLDKRDQTPANLLEINKRIIDDARLQGHDLKNGQQLSDLELLAELQHYGAATCLIDFSYSAQVALWMACQRGSKGTADSKIFNSKVFAVNISNPDRFQKVTSQSLKKDIDCFFTRINAGDIRCINGNLNSRTTVLSLSNLFFCLAVPKLNLRQNA